MSLKLNSSGGGSVLLQEPTTASNLTLNLPAVNATVITDSSGILNIGSGQVYKDASGNVGIGATPAGYRLNVNGNYLCSSGVDITPGTGFSSQFVVSGNGYTGGIALDSTGMWIGQNSGARSLIFACGNNGTTVTERARIDASGNLLVGCTSYPSATVAGGAISAGGLPIRTSTGTFTGAGDHIQFYNGNGSVGYIRTNGTATSYVTSSDYRLKEQVQPMTGALAKVAALKPCTYKWKADGSDGEGFIAHELAEVVPQCVTGEKDAVDADGNPVYQGIDTSFLVATLTAAIQELKAEVDALRAQLEAK